MSDVPNFVLRAAMAKGRIPQRNRLIAMKAADDIRAHKLSCIYEAADKYLPELAGITSEKERRKDFARYIFEDLMKGPKSLHVFQATSRYSKKRNEQPLIRATRHAKVISYFKNK